MRITRDRPYSTAYDLYGNPDKLVEFRVFSLNSCARKCKGCFYDKINNTYDDFHSMRLLAEDMYANGYQLETCYLLPTDIFDNDDNYRLFENEDFYETLKMFAYVGVAATLEDGIKPQLFDLVYQLNGNVGIELQVNLVLQRLRDVNYKMLLQHHIHHIKQLFGERIVINLAVNTGFAVTPHEITTIKKWIKEMSEDGIVELNFTFLYNDGIGATKKRTMLKRSIAAVQTFGSHYQTDPSYNTRFNNRTFMDKPSFAFVGSPNRVYVNPIVPFDEYVFIQNDKYLVTEPSFMGFLQAYGEVTKTNGPILDKCSSCENLTYCMGKHYFAIAKEFGLGCILDEQSGD